MNSTQANLFRCLVILTALLSAAVLPLQAVADVLPVSTFQVDLSRNERLLLEQMVCGQKYGVAVAEIDARAFDAHATNANYADVRCRPHARLKDKPMYYVAQCARHDKQWSCGREELEVSVTLKKRELIIRPGTVEPKLAYETIQKMSSYGYFQGKSLDVALQSTCNMGMGNAPDLIEISCKRWSITVSFWCPKTPEDVACPRIIFMESRQ